jgi:DNA-directed RNA polymerase subunit M/transcription elongation factor TFIIS
MMRFCQICNNMLYPRENKKNKKLEYFCKQTDCGYVDKNIVNSAVYVNELIKDTS